MTFKDLKKDLKLNQIKVAEFFGMNPQSLANSTAKERYKTALCRFYVYAAAKHKEEQKELLRYAFENYFLNAESGKIELKKESFQESTISKTSVNTVLSAFTKIKK